MRVETFHTPGSLRLELSIPTGSISVDTDDGEETRVEIQSADGDPEIEEATHVRHHDGRIVVTMEESRKFLFIRTVPAVHLRIRCPHGVELAAQTVSADVEGRGARVSYVDAKTVSGDMRLEEVSGGARLKTVSGDVRVREVGGDVVHQTVSGDLELGTVHGRVEFRTISGDAAIDDARAGVTGQTVSGDLVLREVKQGSVQLKSVSGDIVIGISRGSGLWVDAKSVSGDTTSDLPLGDEAPAEDAPLVELRATAMSGDIKVMRA